MPGQPLPRRAPHRPDLADLQREQRRTTEQIDRRLGQDRPQQAPCQIGPDEPGVRIGWFWFDSDSTAENP